MGFVSLSGKSADQCLVCILRDTCCSQSIIQADALPHLEQLTYRASYLSLYLVFCVVNSLLSFFAVGIDLLNFSNIQVAAGIAYGARFFALATADWCSKG